jgi:DNA mismatch repair ATPase MutL
MSEDLLYFIFLIIVFIVTMINKALKQKKAPPPAVKGSRPQSKVEKTESIEDIFKRELAERFGVAEPQKKPEAQTKKIQPKAQPKPQPKSASRAISAGSQQRSEAFAQSAFSPPPRMAAADKYMPTDKQLKKEPEQETYAQITMKLFQDRLVWAEILGPPKALRRRHRVI